MGALPQTPQDAFSFFMKEKKAFLRDGIKKTISIISLKNYTNSELKSDQFIVNIASETIKPRNLNNTRRNPILPKHIILVAGLESSGTKYMTSAIDAVINPNDTSKRRRRGRNHLDLRSFQGRVGIKSEIEIIHLSLPHGLWCTFFGDQFENVTSDYLVRVFE